MDKDNPLVSVIIPNYNHAQYLDQRIQSVLSQTYQNFEVIILDDCSPDNGASKAVIEKYRGNPHVSHIVYNEVNSGSTFKQWHKGFELAKGEWIWIAESDDYCDVDFLQTLHCHWIIGNVIVLTDSVYVDSAGNPLYEKDYNNSVVTYDGCDFIRNQMVYSNYPIPNASAVTFRKESALSIENVYMDFKSSGDRFFWILIAEKGKVCKVYSPKNYFRQHDNKVSTRSEANGLQCIENYKINQWLRSHGYVTGLKRVYEFVKYWEYIQSSAIGDSETREQLRKTWFPHWWQNSVSFYLSKIVLYLDAKYCEK